MGGIVWGSLYGSAIGGWFGFVVSDVANYAAMVATVQHRYARAAEYRALSSVAPDIGIWGGFALGSASGAKLEMHIKSTSAATDPALIV